MKQFIHLLIVTSIPIVMAEPDLVSRTILTSDDLKRGKQFQEIEADARANFERGSSFYNSIWVCLDSTKDFITVLCDDLGRDPNEGPKEELQINFLTAGVKHEYGLRHAVQRSECRDMKAKILSLIAKKNAICFLGDMAGAPSPKSKPNEVPTFGWVFTEAKNKNGSVPWF